ncbi:MAG TPA: NAD(P)H-dependent oxidoreductase [Candidatus Salinicoccus merdavium]|nr:NAD(P)H-dependent oxidoreductase [Candidatus Salinicoccus merdavium]
MNLLIISGSPFPGSSTAFLAEEIKAQIEQPENHVEIIDLCQWDIPLLGYPQTEDLEKLKHIAGEADAIIIGTPNFHTSFSGILKNALDHLSFDQFEEKPVALYCTSGGMRNTDPLAQLRMVMRGLHALTIPTQLCASSSDYKKDEAGKYSDLSNEMERRIGKILDSLISLAGMTKSKHQI